MPKISMQRIFLLVALVAALSLTASCGLFRDGLYGVPLPGGADLGDDPYTVRVEFRDVLDLVPQAQVKVNDVPVGRIEAVELGPDGWTPVVSVTVNGRVQLPANAEAEVRQTSLLGEKFVELREPRGVAPQGRLRDGATIPVTRTSRNAEVEEVLGALSLLLNGGGLPQIQTIARELNAALSGKEPQIRALLADLDRLVSALETREGDIIRALDGLNRLSASLAAQRGQIGTALEGLGPGLGVLADQRTQLVGMLQALDRLSVVAVDVINRSQADTVADLRALQPILQRLAQAGTDLPNALELLVTYPFPDAAQDAIKGDYTNLFADIDLNLVEALGNLERSNQPVLPPLPLPDAPFPLLPDTSALPPAPGLPPGGRGAPGPLDLLPGGGR